MKQSATGILIDFSNLENVTETLTGQTKRRPVMKATLMKVETTLADNNEVE